MKQPVILTAKILMNKSLNHNIDESWVDWAIEMMEAGFESENLYILAGITKPYNQFELQELTSRVLHDLNLDYSKRDSIIKNYAYYLISTSINKPETYYNILRELKNICQDMDLDKEYMDFYLLYYAKDDLLESENQWYWEDANRGNIDRIITDQFIIWKNKFELSKRQSHNKLRNPTLAVLFFFCFLIFSCGSDYKKPTQVSPHQAEASVLQPKLNDLKGLKNQLINADTVLLVSHEQTYGPVYNKEKNKWEKAPELIVNNRINARLIREHRIIKDEQLEKLCEILTRPGRDSLAASASCFDPHHALLLIKERKISFIEVCFTCQGITRSADIMISTHDFDSKRWADLYKFIKNQGIKYEL